MYPTKSASVAARRTGARMTSRMTPQGTAQISANAGKTQTRNTSLLLFALPNTGDKLRSSAVRRALSASSPCSAARPTLAEPDCT